MFGPVKFKNQHYSALKDSCVTSGRLFVDTEFPADEQVLTGINEDQELVSAAEVVWSRPRRIVNSASFYTDCNESLVLTRGICASPAITAMCLSLVMHPSTFRATVPDATEQGWSEDEMQEEQDEEDPLLVSSSYSGIFRFRFWQAGEWVEVVIDDFLPTFDGKLLFTGEMQNNFWPALLEKAYAKLLGGYSLIRKQSYEEIWTDFTGGRCYNVSVESLASTADGSEKAKSNLFRRLCEETKGDRDFIWAITKSEIPDEKIGLLGDSVYIATCAKTLTFPTGLFRSNSIEVVRLRNPWHIDGEWKGAFGDKSSEVHELDKTQRKKVGITYDSEDEFYMKIADFQRHFQSLLICRIDRPDDQFQFDAPFSNDNAFDAAECTDASAFFRNPQILVTAKEPSGVNLLLHFTQSASPPPFADIAFDKWAEMDAKASVGVVAAQTELNRRFRVHRFSQTTLDTAIIISPARSRSATLSVKLARKGRYVIIPYCARSKSELQTDDLTKWKMHMRIFNVDRKSYSCELLVDDQPWQVPRWMFCLRNEQLITRVTVKKATIANEERDLKAFDSSLSFMVEISTEGEKVESNVATGTLEPTWNESMIFYRKRPDCNSIVIRLFNYRPLLPNLLIGEATVLNVSECPATETLTALYRTQSPKRRAIKAPEPGTEAVVATDANADAVDSKVMLKSSVTISIASCPDLLYF